MRIFDVRREIEAKTCQVGCEDSANAFDKLVKN